MATATSTARIGEHEHHKTKFTNTSKNTNNMKHIFYYIIALLCLNLTACDPTHDIVPKYESYASFEFKLTASQDLLLYSTPVAIYTDNAGAKDTTELPIEYWKTNNVPNTISTYNTYTIYKYYNSLPAINELEIHFIPNGTYPDNTEETKLHSNLSCSCTAQTEDGAKIIFNELSIDININITEQGNSTTEEWEKEIKKKSRSIRIGVDKDGKIIKGDSTN